MPGRNTGIGSAHTTRGEFDVRRSHPPLIEAASPCDVALLLVSAVLSAAPAAAHTFTKNDGNDSPSKIDIRSASVSQHRRAWCTRSRPGTRGHRRASSTIRSSSSSIDKDSDPDYERCAFIFYTDAAPRLALQLRSTVHPVPARREGVGHDGEDHDPQEPDSATSTGGRLRASGSEQLRVETGASTSRRTTFPDILHDLMPPVVTMDRDAAPRVGGVDDPDVRLPVLRLRRALGDRVVDRPAPRARNHGPWSDVVSGSTSGGSTRISPATRADGSTTGSWLGTSKGIR